MPVIFVTVEESLGDLAKLKKGESVLIHAAAGGVGLVAIQYLESNYITFTTNDTIIQYLCTY